jgi:hypothetical protein
LVFHFLIGFLNVITFFQITIKDISSGKDKKDLCDSSLLFNSIIRDIKIYAHPDKIKQKDLAFDLCSLESKKEIYF